MKYLQFFLFVFLFALFNFSNLLSQRLDSIIGLEEVTVTGVRYKHFNTGHFYTSVDSATKAVQASSYLGDVLTNSSLFQINSYGVGSVSVSARGMGDKRTPVVWNGFNIQNIMSTGTDLDQLPSFFFEDVRAQMGGSSALFGSGAAGGVLFLNNKQKFNGGIKGQFLSHYGSFGNYYTGEEVSFANGNYSGSVKAYFNQAKNNFKYHANYSGIEIDTTQVNANAKQYGFMLNNFFRLTSTQLLNVNFWYTKSDKNIAPTLSDVAYNNVADGSQKDKFIATSAEYNLKLDNVDIFARSGYFNSGLDYEKPSWMQVSNSKASWWVNELESSVNFLNHFKLNGGLNFTYEQVKSSSFPQKNSRYREAVFASVKAYDTKTRFSFAANGRGEIVAGEFIPFTYSFGLEFDPFSLINLKGNISKNYRLPSFNDLYYLDAYSQGNSDLKPEDGMNYEIGLQFSKKTNFFTISVGTNLFSSRMDNWINWAARPDGIWSVFNVDKAEISGVESFIESSIKNAVSELSVSAMYTWSEAKDRNTQHFLTNVPKKKFTFNFKYRIYGTSITIMSANVGERYSDAANTKSIAAYNISNVILTQTVKFLGSSVSVDLGVYNVFNKDYMVMDGYPMPKRNFRAGLRILF